MNTIQKNEDPKAFEPEIVKTIQLKQLRENEIKKQMESFNQIKQNKLREKIEHEKALFDFDQDIDDLEEVEERYPA